MPLSPNALGAVVEVFEGNFRDRGELGASISVWRDGEELLELGHGWCQRGAPLPWTCGTLVPVYSATKVPAAATLLLALERRGMNEQTAVGEVWPNFPLPAATFAQLLSHQCGLAVLDRRASILHHEEVVAAIEAQQPFWRPGQGHGYHPRTYGALLEEPVRRLTGLSLGDYWREEIAEPLDLDFWIGLPSCEWPRVAKLYPGKADKDELVDAFYKQLTTSGTFTRRAFSSPRGLHAVHEMNDPVAWSAGNPAMGGIGTARALAKFYQAAMGRLAGPLSEDIQRALSTLQSTAEDRVLLRRTAFTCGAQQDPLDGLGHKQRHIYGPSIRAFGHPGAGGSHAFGDPDSGVSFAYVMNQMDLSVMPGAKCLGMVSALFER